VTTLSLLSPAPAGFDGAKGIRIPVPDQEDLRIHLKRSKTVLPSDTPRVDFTEQLIWLHPDDQPARLLWCNADDQWFELSFTPIDKP
jgi:hypothetical protein